jgi:transposase
MSVYAGIDVHRKRSQVAVIDQSGEVLANRNVPNGISTILGVIGGLPAGTPAASGAAFGWGWLAGLLENYGFRTHLVHPLQCKAIASARLKNDKGRRGDLGSAATGRPAPRGVDRPPAVRQLRAILRHRAAQPPLINLAHPASSRCCTEPSSSAVHCPARGHRV